MKPFLKHGTVTLYHSACEDVIGSLRAYDLWLADPPYGQGLHQSNMGRGRKPTKMTGVNRPGYSPGNTEFAAGAEWDEAPPPAELFTAMMRRTRKQVIWGGQYFQLPVTRGWLIWDKAHSLDFGHCEMAWSSLDQPLKRIVHKWNGMLQEAGHKEKRWHIAQKPQRVLNWILDMVPDVRTVIDTHAGGGSTGVACQRRGLICTLIEKDERNCEVIAQRLRKEAPL
jgi:DNA modification methylase